MTRWRPVIVQSRFGSSRIVPRANEGDAPRRFYCQPAYFGATVAFTDKIYVKNHRQLASQLETNIPKGAFAGATLDMLFTGDGLSKLDSTTRDRILDFAEDFLDCDCQANPYCGCPEETFMRYVLELRAEGLRPQAIVDVMTDDYMVYAYTGDVLSFLDDAVRNLEAVETLADVEGNEEMADRARRAKRELSG